ncbi:septal ring lytic transglycosylase RlpA family protein [Sphaerotilus uruguayifluvii]|uniref:Endolytic peptidoglycan transglycosylase RlpA n=1 Tax=Sphaerotilus uruguayifluvii TaxID=2735897 RepID=A0ABX2G5J7_9BURK|nr:rare lipoprotein A [Leptothrix sp. C29]
MPTVPARPDVPTLPRPRTAAFLIAAIAAALLVAGCSTAPKGGQRPRRVDPGQRDGAPASWPFDLNQVPDAQPRVEPIRRGGPNKPYEVMGQQYVPMTADEPLRESGLASWYGTKFHGAPTASGEIYDMYAMTAAHPTMPLPSYARVRNPINGREVIVRVNDRGPFHPGRIIDLSLSAAVRLGVAGSVGPVEVERLTHDDIRSGRWQR